MRKSIVTGGTLLAAVAVTVFCLGGQSAGQADARLPLTIKSFQNARDMSIEIVSHGKAPVYVHRVLINDRSGKKDCDFHFSKTEYNDVDTDHATLSGTANLTEGENLVVDLAVGGPCGVTISRVRVETEQGSEDFDIK